MNPFAFTRNYQKLSNIFTAPMFRPLPAPRGFALVTTTGRRSGKARRRPVRAAREGDTFYAIAILGERSDWLRNARANPEVRLKTGARTRAARARDISDAEERQRAEALYVDRVYPFDYVDYVALHWGFPTANKIRAAHRQWLEKGALVTLDLVRESG